MTCPCILVKDSLLGGLVVHNKGSVPVLTDLVRQLFVLLILFLYLTTGKTDSLTEFGPIT